MSATSNRQAPNRTTVEYQNTSGNEIYFYTPVAPEPGALRLGLMYPAGYSISMSSLGYLMLFQQLDVNPLVDARRITMDNLETAPTNDLEMMGFSFAFELDVINILKMLETTGVPLYQADRNREHPLVFAGGPVPMSNPEPFADFFDFFLIGEGEEMLQQLVLAYQECRHIDNRQALLLALAQKVPGLYAPSLYQVTYQSNDGPIAAITPISPDVPFPVGKQIVSNLDTVVAATPILSDKAIFADTFLIEVMRGCAHRCRFCLASYVMLPARGPSITPVLERIELGLQHTHKLGLLGALIANHPDFGQICDRLEHEADRRPDLAVSASSLRADTMTEQIARTFKKTKQNQLTIAVETGSERLRRRINKNLKHEEILNAASVVASVGMRGLKLYGMVGLPDETDDDVLSLVALAKDIKKQNPKLELVLGCSSFVPKGGTPFQWQPKINNKLVDHRFGLLRKGLLKVADLRAGSAKWDFFQAFLSRGDRRLSPLLIRFYQLGGSLGSLNRAYKELKEEGLANFPAPEWYAERERPEDEILPWEAIHLGVDKAILWKEGLAPAGFEAP